MVGLTCYQYLLISLLIAAVLMDFAYDRIYNGWILFGIMIGLLFRFLEYQWHGLYEAAVSMLLSFALLYPLYKINGFGAGDVKLFLMLGSFVQAGELLRMMIASFIIGAVFSIVKMLSEKNLRERIQYLYEYLSDVFHKKQWRLYGENLQWDYQGYMSNKIHFALPVLLSAALWSGGFF
ncbi:MAG: A24 family peptidase [Lachnospiraceae bacterium]|nr:A24 family peptidase [Lachnospiraceae bacterium]